MPIAARFGRLVFDGTGLNFTLPVEAARLKAREILNSPPQDGGNHRREQWRNCRMG